MQNKLKHKTAKIGLKIMAKMGAKAANAKIAAAKSLKDAAASSSIPPIPPIPPIAPPAIPPAMPPPKHEAIGKMYRIISDAAPQAHWGLQGIVMHVDADKQHCMTYRIKCASQASTLMPRAAWCQCVDGLPFRPPCKSMASLNRDAAIPAPMRDVGLLDPILSHDYSHCLSDAKCDPNVRDRIVKQMKSCLKCRRLMALIGAGGHWTLMVCDISDDGIITNVRYYETLTQPSNECQVMASSVLKIISDGKHQLPSRSNASFQPVGLGVCGFYVLSWMEIEWLDCMGFGLASTVHPKLLWLTWKLRLISFTKALHKEMEKQLCDRKKADEAASARMAKAKAKAIQGSKIDAAASSSSAAAAVMVDEGHAFRESDLSADAHKGIAKVRLEGVGTCSRCRFRMGCLGCHVDKCIAYHMKKERDEFYAKRLR